LLLVPWLARARVHVVLLAGLGVSWIWRGAAFALAHGRLISGLNATWFFTAQLPGVLDEFALGIALAMVLHRDRGRGMERALERFRWWLVGAAAVVGWLTFSVLFEHREYWHEVGMVVFWRGLFGMFCLMVVVAACGFRGPRFLALTAPFRYLGTISYGIYLWHWVVLFALRRYFHPAPPNALLWVLGLSLGLAALSWHLFEKPLMERFGRNRRARGVLAAPHTPVAPGVQTPRPELTGGLG
jgi:peptidoglycan/LPS O-acetylase OafA/YrhL